MFTDIFEGKLGAIGCVVGSYRAAVSLYMGAQCRVNFGATPFKHQPQSAEQWKPYKDILGNRSRMVYTPMPLPVAPPLAATQAKPVLV